MPLRRWCWERSTSAGSAGSSCSWAVRTSSCRAGSRTRRIRHMCSLHVTKTVSTEPRYSVNVSVRVSVRVRARAVELRQHCGFAPSKQSAGQRQGCLRCSHPGNNRQYMREATCIDLQSCACQPGAGSGRRVHEAGSRSRCEPGSGPPEGQQLPESGVQRRSPASQQTVALFVFFRQLSQHTVIPSFGDGQCCCPALPA